MIIFYAFGEREKARELVKIITKTRWKIISKHAMKMSSSSIGPTVIIFRPTKAGLAVALWLQRVAQEMGMMASVGWFTSIDKFSEDVESAVKSNLKRKYMLPLETPWTPE